MVSQRILPPKLASSFEAKYSRTRSFTLPANKFFHYTAYQNEPNSLYFNAGITTLGINPGNSDLKETPLKRNTIVGADFLKAYAVAALGGKIVANWSEPDCINAVDYFFATKEGGLGVLTGQTDEAGPGFQEWSAVHSPYAGYCCPSPAQYIFLEKAFGAKTRLLGGEYFGNYGGSINITAALSNSLSALRLALNGTNQQALDFVKLTDASNPFFTQELWRYRSLLVNNYNTGSQINAQELAKVTSSMELGKKALTAVGIPNGRIMNFIWPGYREIYSVGYRHYVSDGYMQSFHDPLYSISYQTALAYLTYVLASDLYSWGDTVRYGVNPSIIVPDETREDGFPVKKYYGSNRPATAGIDYRYVQRDLGYVDTALGSSHDAIFIGIEQYCKMVEWAGQESVWVGVKKAGAANFSTVSGSYVVDAYTNQTPIARVHSLGNKRALFFYDVIERPGTRTLYTINLNGAEYNLSAESGVPYFILIDLT